MSSTSIKRKLRQRVAVSKLQQKFMLKSFNVASRKIAFQSWMNVTFLEKKSGLEALRFSGQIARLSQKYDGAVLHLLDVYEVSNEKTLIQRIFARWKSLTMRAAFTAPLSTPPPPPVVKAPPDEPHSVIVEPPQIEPRSVEVEATTPPLAPPASPSPPPALEEEDTSSEYTDVEAVIVHRVEEKALHQPVTTDRASSSLHSLLDELRMRIAEEVYVVGEQFYGIVEPDEAAYGARMPSTTSPKVKFRACLEWMKNGQLSWLVATYMRVLNSIKNLDVDQGMRFHQKKNRNLSSANSQNFGEELSLLRDVMDVVWSANRVQERQGDAPSYHTGASPVHASVLPLDRSGRYEAFRSHDVYPVSKGREEISHVHPRSFWLLVKPVTEDATCRQIEKHLWKILHLIATHDRRAGLRLYRSEGQRKVSIRQCGIMGSNVCCECVLWLTTK